MKKRILSFLLALLMVVSIFPAPAFATDSTDVTITPTETPTEAATEASCTTCGTVGCTSEHLNWCSDCQKDDCGQNHCDTCGAIDCSTEHKTCDKCGTLDCTADHTNWCADCKVDNCGQNHCPTCGTIDCTKEHKPCETCAVIDCTADHTNWCEICKYDNCGKDHNATEPTEPATEPVAAIDEGDEEGPHPMMGKAVKLNPDAGSYWGYREPNWTTTIIGKDGYPSVMEVREVIEKDGVDYCRLAAVQGSWADVTYDDTLYLEAAKLTVVTWCTECEEYDCGTDHTQPENPCGCCDDCTGAEGCDCQCGECDFCVKEEEPSDPVYTDEETGIQVELESFVEGVKLKVSEADVSAQLNNFGIPVNKLVFGLDISMSKDGSEYQPEGGALVKIPVSASEGTMIGILHTHGDDTIFMGLTEVLEDGTVEFYTDGFSEFAGFTVDFHYNGVDFSIDGMTSILLSDLFEAMGINEDVSQVTSIVFSDNTLVDVVEEGNDWRLTSLKAFQTEETLVISFYNGDVLTIGVTDAVYYNSYLDGLIVFQAGTSGIFGPAQDSNFVVHYVNGSTASANVKHYLRTTAKESAITISRTGYWYHVYSWTNAEISTHQDQTKATNNIAFTRDGGDPTVHIQEYSTAINLTGSGAGLVTVSIHARTSTGMNQRNVVVKLNGNEVARANNVPFPDRTIDAANVYNKNGLNFSWYDSSKYYAVYDSNTGNNYSFDGTTYTINLYSRYNVSFDANGGTGSMGNQAFVWGTAQNLNANAFSAPTFTVSYDSKGGTALQNATASTKFSHWNTKADGTGYTVSNNTHLENNVKPNAGDTVAVYARWTATSSVTLPTPTRVGYTFNGWYENEAYTVKAGDAGASYTPTKSVTLYAKWNENTDTAYTVNHYKQNLDNTYSAAPTETQKLTGTTGATIKPAVKSYTGFTSPAVQETTILADGSRVVSYYYTRDSYNVTVTAGTTGIQSVTGGGSYKYDASVTINATLKDGYQWNNWTGTSTQAAQSYTFNMPANNVSYTANATPIPYTITYDLTDDNGVTGTNHTSNPSGYTVESATITLCDPTPPEGYEFVRWSEGDTITAGSTGNKTFTAEWKPIEYTITYNANGGTNAPTAQTKIHGTDLTITSVQPTHTSLTFVGWSTDPDAEEPEETYGAGSVYSTNADLTLYAVWKAELYVTIGYEDANGNFVYSGTVTYSYDQSVWGEGKCAVTTYWPIGDGIDQELVFTPKNGYQIIKVTVNAVEQSGTYGQNDAYTYEFGSTGIRENTRIVVTTQRVSTAYLKTTIDNGGSIMYDLKDGSPTGSLESGVTYPFDISSFPGTVITFTPAEGYEIYEVTTREPNESLVVTTETLQSYSYTIGTNGLAEGNTEIEVKTRKKTYTVTWLNDDDSIISTSRLEHGELPTHADPSKEATAEFAYTFAGWTPEVVAVTGNATYKATYTPVPRLYTVTVIYLDSQVTATGMNGYTEVDGKWQKSVAYDAVINLGFVAKAGYAISTVTVGSDTIATFQGEINQTVKSDITITVQSEIIAYNINYELNGGVLAEDVTNPGTYTVETETFTLNNPTKAGYKFVGWATSENANTGAETVTIVQGTTGDKTFYAVWEKSLVDLTITATTANSEQNFIFTVSGTRSDGVAFTPIDVVLCSDNNFQVTIKDMPVGEYTVTEKDGWSWRENAVDNKPADLRTTSQTVSFDFGVVDDLHWLSGYSYRKKGGS